MVAGEGNVVCGVVILSCDTRHEARLGEEIVDKGGNRSAISNGEGSILLSASIIDGCTSASPSFSSCLGQFFRRLTGGQKSSCISTMIRAGTNGPLSLPLNSMTKVVRETWILFR